MTSPDDDDLKPLGVTCTSTDCDNGLHCFLQKGRKPAGALRRGGPCRDCGADLVEWERVTLRKIGDTAYTFEALRGEMIRHVFWHSSFTQKELNHAVRKGLRLLRAAAERRIAQSVGRAENPREGRQTPFHGNVLYHGQHAVAACCRKCIEYWHGIPSGRALEPAEVEYLVELVTRYVKERLPTLRDEPTTVPSIRSAPPSAAA